MEEPPHLDATEQEDKVDRLLPRVDIGNYLVGVSPEHQNFVSCSNCATADHTPEDVVPQLIASKKLAFPVAIHSDVYLYYRP